MDDGSAAVTRLLGDLSEQRGLADSSDAVEIHDQRAVRLQALQHSGNLLGPPDEVIRRPLSEDVSHPYSYGHDASLSESV